LARLNRLAANRVVRRVAPYLPPMVLIVHKGRKTGRVYRTPVIGWRSGQTLCVVLYYGAESDWTRNVLAGPAEVIRAGRAYPLTGVRVVQPDDPALAPAVRRLAVQRHRVLIGDLVP
jgi:deazaflavin-dependent oxidoreductase (nitroreductase family)